MNRTAFIRDYISYYLNAKTKHDIHSPFVFEFVTKVLNGKTQNEYTHCIEKLRREMLSSSGEIEVCDLGVGGPSKSLRKTSIRDIVRNSAKSRKYAALLHRIISYYGHRKMLELGTSAGISSMYMASANPQGKLITIEGDKEIAKLAAGNFAKAGITNITQVVGNFDDVLRGILEKEQYFDLIFFDGNHREEATIRYFEQCLPHIHNETIFIFDDINWSEGMKKAWEKIRQHPSVKVTLDLYFLGIVFFRKELSKENFVIRF